MAYPPGLCHSEQRRVFEVLICARPDAQLQLMMRGFSCRSVVQNDNSPEQQMTHEMLIRNDTGITLNSNPNWFKVLTKSTLDSQLKALKIVFLIQYQYKSSLVHAENKILAEVETFNWLVTYLSRHDVFIGVVSCSKKRQKGYMRRILQEISSSFKKKNFKSLITTA